MSLWRSRILWAGAALIVAANATILAGVALNRREAPESTLRLTQRELLAPYPWGLSRESSGIALRIAYRTASPPAHAPAWIDEAQLAALGVDVAKLRPRGERRGGHPAHLEALLVLELDGPAYAASLARARQRADEDRAVAAANPGNESFAKRAAISASGLAREENLASRLFVVDAGRDREALRAKYPDRARYAIVSGHLRPTREANGRAGAWVESLSVPELNVPAPYRESLAGQLAQARPARHDEPRGRYALDVAWGQRLQPFVVSATPP